MQWMAHVAAERIDQLQDPELSIEVGVRPERATAHSPGQSEATPWVCDKPSNEIRPERAKALNYRAL